MHRGNEETGRCRRISIAGKVVLNVIRRKRLVIPVAASAIVVGIAAVLRWDRNTVDGIILGTGESTPGVALQSELLSDVLVAVFGPLAVACVLVVLAGLIIGIRGVCSETLDVPCERITEDE